MATRTQASATSIAQISQRRSRHETFGLAIMLRNLKSAAVRWTASKDLGIEIYCQNEDYCAHVITGSGPTG
eukprot:3293347-Rhodomonas_salina.2